jgi:hypothetical protein
MTLDDLSPQELDLAAHTGGDLPLGSAAPEHLLELLVDRLSWFHPTVAGKLCGLSTYERTVLFEYLVETARLPIAVAV